MVLENSEAQPTLDGSMSFKLHLTSGLQDQRVEMSGVWRAENKNTNNMILHSGSKAQDTGIPGTMVCENSSVGLLGP